MSCFVRLLLLFAFVLYNMSEFMYSACDCRKDMQRTNLKMFWYLLLTCSRVYFLITIKNLTR